MAARSFCTNAGALDALLRVLRETRSEVASPAGGIIFVSGALAPHLPTLAARVRTVWKGFPTVLVPGSGVLNERGEIEGAPAASGLLWSGGKALPIALGGPEDPARELGEAIGSALGPRPGTVMLFHRPEGFDPALLEGLSSTMPGACVFGAGTVGGSAVVITPEGEVLSGRAVALSVAGLASPLVAASPACRLVTDMRTIEEVSGGLVLRMGGRSALEELSLAAPNVGSGGGEGQPLVFAALAEGDEPLSEDGRTRYVVRPVRGIDPARRGVMIGGEARPGMRLAFGVRDAAAARTNLEATARTLAKNALGAAPRFAIYLSCAGRGQGLYGAPDVESRILRQRFGDLPIAGMHSSFEISPRPKGPARLELYTGVLALFRSPS
jgi:small ligand-binding sensory domain FIST